MKNRLVILGADFSANAILGKVETSYSLNVDITSVDVPRLSPVTIYARSEMQTYNDDVLMGSGPAPISVSATNGVVATVGDPDGSIYPIVIDGSAATAESCTVTIAQIGSSNIATVEAICQIYAIKRATNAPLMDAVYAQGWSASPDYMTFTEAAAVTTFGTAFKDNTEVTTFEEAKYFTGLTTSKADQFANSSIARLDLSGLQNVQGSMSYAFRNATLLEYLNLEGFNASNITSLQNAWDNCSKLTRLDISSWTDTSKVATAYGGTQMFAGCTSLEEVNLPENFCPNCPSFYLMMWYYSYPIKKFTGWFNLQSAGTYPSFQGAPQLRQLEMRNMGTVESVTAIDYSRLSVWGVNSDEVPDAEQSLKNSFDTLYDRASAGYDAITITVPEATLEVMKRIYGDDGMLAIIDKGYTIANYTPIYSPDRAYDIIASLDGAVMFYNSGAEALLASEDHESVLGVAPKIDFIGCVADDAGVVSAVYDMSGASYSVTNVSVVDGKLRPTDSTTFGKITLTRTKECSALYYEGTPLLGSGKLQVFINNILQSYTGISAIFYQSGKTNIQVNNVIADVRGVTTDTINQLLVKVSGDTTADISLVEVNGSDVTAQLGDGADFWGSQGETPFITIGNDFETFYAG